MMIRLEINQEERSELNYLVDSAIRAELRSYTMAVSTGAEDVAMKIYKTVEMLKEIQLRMYDLGNEIIEITPEGLGYALSKESEVVNF